MLTVPSTKREEWPSCTFSESGEIVLNGIWSIFEHRGGSQLAIFEEQPRPVSANLEGILAGINNFNGVEVLQRSPKNFCVYYLRRLVPRISFFGALFCRKGSAMPCPDESSCFIFLCEIDYVSKSGFVGEPFGVCCLVRTYLIIHRENRRIHYVNWLLKI